MSRLGDESTIEIRRGRALLGALTALGALCVIVVVGIDTAPAQTSTLVCVKQNKPRKGTVRIPANALCRGNERGVLLNATGPQGSQGVQGSQGPPGPLSGYERVNSAPGVQPAGTLSATQPVNCPLGKKVLGGGFTIGQDNAADQIIATESRALDDDTWQVGARAVGTPAGGWTLTAWATCATA